MAQHHIDIDRWSNWQPRHCIVAAKAVRVLWMISDHIHDLVLTLTSWSGTATFDVHPRSPSTPARPAWVSITGDHNGHPLEVWVGRLGFRPAPKAIRQALHERSPWCGQLRTLGTRTDTCCPKIDSDPHPGVIAFRSLWPSTKLPKLPIFPKESWLRHRQRSRSRNPGHLLRPSLELCENASQSMVSVVSVSRSERCDYPALHHVQYCSIQRIPTGWVTGWIAGFQTNFQTNILNIINWSYHLDRCWFILARGATPSRAM